MFVQVLSFQYGEFYYIYEVYGWMMSWCDVDQIEVCYVYDSFGCVVEIGICEGYYIGCFVYEDGVMCVFDIDGEWFYVYNVEGLVICEVNLFGYVI